MLNLKNVRKEGNRVFADYYPENWGEFGTVSVSVDDFDDYTFILSDRDKKEYSAYPYAINALNALRRMIENGEELKDAMVMWC